MGIWYATFLLALAMGFAAITSVNGDAETRGLIFYMGAEIFIFTTVILSAELILLVSIQSCLFPLIKYCSSIVGIYH